MVGVYAQKTDFSSLAGITTNNLFWLRVGLSVRFPFSVLGFCLA